MIGTLVKNKKLLETLELEIRLYALTHSNRRTEGFINRIFAYLRENMELLQDDNYKKLYDECFLLSKWLRRKEYKLEQKNYEIVTDIMNKHEDFAYSKEFVDDYLKFRMDAWKTGYYDKLFE